MKFIFTLLAVAFLSFNSYAQDRKIKEIARLIVSDVRNNKVDVTQHFLEGKAYTLFFNIEGDNDTYMANILPAKDSHSSGKIYGLKTTIEGETADNYRNETLTFNWSYTNNYDNKEGTATVSLQLIYKPVGTAYTMTMVTEGLDVLVYKGYVKGSLNLLR